MNSPTSHEIDYPRGTILFQEGDKSEEIYVIKYGKIKINTIINGIKTTVATLVEGDFFGEMAFLMGMPRSAEAEVIEDCRIVQFHPKHLTDMIKSNHKIGTKMIKILVNRVAECNERIESLQTREKQSKIVLYMLKEHRVHHSKCGKPHLFQLNLKKMQEQTGVHIDIIEESLQKMNRSQLIEYSSAGLFIKDIKQLKDYFIFLTEQDLKL